MPKKTQLKLPTLTAKPTDPTLDGPLPVDKSAIHLPGPNTKLQIKHKDSNTLKNLINMYIGMGLDMALALEKLRPGYEARQYIIYAEYLLSQPHIKEGIDKALEDAGGGLHNKNEFIAFITRMAQRGSEKERLSAWRILARLHGIGEDAGTERPTELPVSFNTGDGLKQMLGEEVYNEVALAKE